jgi:hypothetical protein
MIRTHIYLREDQTSGIKRKARQEHRPEAALVRELVDLGWSVKYPLGQTDNPLLQLAKLGEELGVKGPADLSSRIDDYLYGKDV